MVRFTIIQRLAGIVRLLVALWRSMPILITIWLLVPVTIGLLIVPVLTAHKQLINVMVNDLSNTPWQDILASAMPSLLMFTGVMLLQEAMEVFRRWVSFYLTEKATLFIQDQIIDVSVNVPFESFDNPEFHDRLKRAQAFIGNDLVGILNDAVQTVKIVSTMVGLLLVVLSSGYWSATVIVFLMIVVNLFIKLSTEIKVRKLNREMTHDGRMADYLKTLLMEPVTIRELRIYDSLRFLTEIWGNITRTQHSRRYGARRNEIKIGGLTGLIQTTAVLSVLLLMVKELTAGLISVGMITVMFMAMIRAGNQIISLTWPLSRLYVQGTKAVDLVEFLKEKEKLLIAHADESKIQAKPLQEITFDNVSFKYLNSSVNVLKDISFTIKKGEKIAIVGENGAGKSTLVRLLMGLYKPAQGTVKWNGRNVLNLDLSNRITAIFQDFVRYELSLRENVAFGNLNNLNNDEKILTTLRQCGLYSLFEDLGTLDAPLGRILENGRELSGGQWQRLALSRATISDADLIILDEPTSALDPIAEVEIYKQFQELCRDATAIFISHRLGWARYADRIFVLDKGELVEVGTHEELIKANGLYSEYFRTQASLYTGGGEKEGMLT